MTLRVRGGGGQSDGYQPGDPPLHPVLGLPRVLGRPLDCAHHGHHIRVSDILFSNAVLGVVTSDNNNQTSEPGKAEPETEQLQTFALVTFYLHHFREGSGPSSVWADINNVSGHKDFPATVMISPILRS